MATAACLSPRDELKLFFVDGVNSKTLSTVKMRGYAKKQANMYFISGEEKKKHSTQEHLVENNSAWPLINGKFKRCKFRKTD